MMDNPKRNLARLFMLVAIVCGVIGLAAGVAEKEWLLTVTGWFTGGTLLAVLSLVTIVDEYVTTRSPSDG